MPAVALSPQDIVEFQNKYMSHNGDAPDLHVINDNNPFSVDINHYNPKEMIKRVNFPNPQKVQNMNFFHVAAVQLFNKMFEDLT